MGLRSTHPEYDAILNDLRQMRDTLAGQRQVKNAGYLYLPPTASMLLDGLGSGLEPGTSAYRAYITRAIFPDVTEVAQSTMVGLLNKESAEISLPKRMEPLLERCTRQGETIYQLLRRINTSQLGYGRIGLLIDVAPGATLPHIVTYESENITNWDQQRVNEQGLDMTSFVTLSEDALVRGGEATNSYDWTVEERYRALILTDTGNYGTYTEVNEQTSEVIIPSFNGKVLDFIPFTFIGANDLVASPGSMPLLGLSNSALAIYRGEADFRQTLHMLGQDTLVLTGISPGTEADVEEVTRIGSGAKIEVPEGGDAKFIGIASDGLPEQRMALEEDYARSNAMGARLLENSGSQAESGEALRVRVSAKTTTLHSVAITAGAGLQEALKNIAIWIGEDPDEVIVNVNTDFIEDNAKPEEAAKFMEAKHNGLPVSYRTIHEWSEKNELTQKTFEQEMKEIVEEAQLIEVLKKGIIQPEPVGGTPAPPSPDTEE